MMSSLTEFCVVVWRIRKLILTELLLAIIWRGLAFCLLGFTARCKFILWIGKVKLLLLLLVFWPWYLLGILEMDSAIPNNIVSGCHPYCSSSSYSLRWFVFSICWGGFLMINFSTIIVFEISSWRESLMAFLTTSAFLFM